MMPKLAGLAEQAAGLSGWRRLTVLVLAGAATTMAFAPFHQPWILWPAFAVLVWSLGGATTARAAFTAGFWFAYGQFLAGLYWITSAFLVDAATFGWLLPFPLFGLPAVLALFPALGMFLAWRLSASGGIIRVLMIAVFWTFSELARGYLFTGFPWNLIGYATGVHVAAMQPAAWIGIYGLSFLVVAAAAGAALVLDGRNWRSKRERMYGGILLALALPVLIVITGAIRLQPAQYATDAPVIRVVQANIPQSEKWLAETRDANFLMQLNMSRAPAEPGIGAPEVVVWPETAATYYLSHDPLRRQQLSALAGSLSPRGAVITGSLHAQPLEDDRQGIYNTAYGISASNQDQPEVYAKRHLVPFGEYLPFRPVLSKIGLHALAEARGDFSSGPVSGLFRMRGLPPARILICYEAIFPGEVAVTAEPAQPSWLINLTNDAWFGKLTGPYQHFDMARFRAVEQGAPLVRAAGTGISGLVDPYGRNVALIGLGEKGTVDFRLPDRIEAASLPNNAVEILLLVLAAFAVLLNVFSRLSEKQR